MDRNGGKQLNIPDWRKAEINDSSCSKMPHTIKSIAREASSWEYLKCPGKCPRRARVTFNYLSVSESSIYKNTWELPIPFHSLLPYLTNGYGWIWSWPVGAKMSLKVLSLYQANRSILPPFPWNFSLCQPQMIRLKAKQLRNVDYHIGLDILFSKFIIFMRKWTNHILLPENDQFSSGPV